MLASRRIDCWAIGNVSLGQILREAKIPPNLITQAFTLKTVSLNIAFSKQVPDQTISQWQETLDALKAEGIYQEIMQRHNSANVMAF